MHCPSCKQPGYRWTEPCPYCGFDADPAQVETLAHLRWFLTELDGWRLDVPEAVSSLLKTNYTGRLRKLEVALHLRQPPASVAEAAHLWPLLYQDNVLLEYINDWRKRGFLNMAAAQSLLEALRVRRDERLDRLSGHHPPDAPPTDSDRLMAISAVIKLVDDLRKANAFATPDAPQRLFPELLSEKQRLRYALGLGEPEPEVVVVKPPPLPKPEPSQKAPRESKAPAAPAIPFHERLWRFLSTDRIFNAILFLTIFVFFAADISFVVWGEKDLPWRVLVPAGFTVFFFALGRYFRTKTSLYNSGIALSAIGSLVIPIDFYTVYTSFGIAPELAPEFWLFTSLVCLAVYSVATLVIQNRLFGYLVGFAAGTVAWMGVDLVHKFMGFSLDWHGADVSLVCAGLVGMAAYLSRRGQRWQVFVDPFRYLAMFGVSACALALLGWRIYSDGVTFATLRGALPVTWWVAALVLGWGALFYRSRELWTIAVAALPAAVLMTQMAWFDAAGVNKAWYAFGGALLVTFYVALGDWLAQRQKVATDPVIRSWMRTTNVWAVVLLLLSALWPFTDLSSGMPLACCHALLVGAVVLAAWLWRRPEYLYGASMLAFSATSFVMTELDLPLVNLCVGWASLAILHILLAYGLSRDPARSTQTILTVPLVAAGYGIAALSALLPWVSDDKGLLIYALGNWIALLAWGARLAHQERAGFVAHLPEKGLLRILRSLEPEALYHWAIALLIPFWLWFAYTHLRPVGLPLTLALAALSWGMVFLSYRLGKMRAAYLPPWRKTGLAVSAVAPLLAAFVVRDDWATALCLLSAGCLCFTDAVIRRVSFELAFGGTALAGSVFLFCDCFDLSSGAMSFVMTALIMSYILAGLLVERRRSPVFTHTFLEPLYLVAHFLAVGVVIAAYIPPFAELVADIAWPVAMQRWGAASQLLLGVTYGLFAWGTYREVWGYVASWVGMAGAGFLVFAYSQGRGSSATKVALIAIVYVLAERALRGFMQAGRLTRRRRAYVRLAWALYRRPLLTAGWTLSVITIGLALVRNLWILGGGRTREVWSAAGLLLITGLYALSARMFHRRRFVWFAAILVFAPWTILTDLGWFTPYRLTTPGFAASWVVLAWVLFGVNRLVRRFAPDDYALPLRIVAHVLIPFSLCWGIANPETSRVTFGLAAAYYGVAAWLDYREAVAALRLGTISGALPLRVTRFLYPALGLIPVWAVYLLACHQPQVCHELYGLLLLGFGPLGLIAGNLLRYVRPLPVNAASHRPAYGIPAYLTGYLALIVGTLLTAHVAGLLSLAILYDALLLAASALIFRDPVWLYPAAALVPLSMLIALNEAGIPGNRHGWWLIGLAVFYFWIAWLLRRVRQAAYGAAPLALGFVVLALALPPSSEDQIGALWGYGWAALLYAVTAFWLKQPLLLAASGALSLVPYAVSLQRSVIPSEYYGLMLLPGAVIALALGYWLDRARGSWRDFPWAEPARWPVAFVDRLLGWWALPCYVLGFGLGVAAPYFTAGRADLAAFNCLLLVLLFAWALIYFRRRGWLLALALAVQFALGLYLDFRGWWQYPVWAWAQFLPVTMLTVGAAFWIEQTRGESPPLLNVRQSYRLRPLLAGWSRPLYLVAFVDILLAQYAAIRGGMDTEVGALISLVHMLLIGVLSSAWGAPLLPYLSALLGALALGQKGFASGLSVFDLSAWLAVLACGYGAVGYGLELWRDFSPGQRKLPSWLAIWRLSLQQIGLLLSIETLVLSSIDLLEVFAGVLAALFGFTYEPRMDVLGIAVAVLAWLGLLYVIATVTKHRQRLSYAATAMLLASWMLYAFYIRRWDDVLALQLYALPAGVYLLGIAFLEGRSGNRKLVPWLDYGGMFLLIMPLFWQTYRYGWRYALMLGAVGFGLIVYGSARRVRSFFYAGMLGVVLATVGQLINTFQVVNQWIVFGLVGLLLAGIIVTVERKRAQIKTSQGEDPEDWE
ncbi:MAG: hypothetical protein JXA21_24580 [Anaerolineae bacterium]|nr:hypothetical protein [Anaerolineae bacterium]